MLSCTELTEAKSHAPIVQAQSHTHLNKTLKRQRAIHMDRYTHAQSHTTHKSTEYRTDTSREPCTNSTSSIAHPLEQNAQEAESYTHGQVHTCSIAHLHEYRTHTSRHNSTSSIAHPLELNAQEAESYIHGQVRTCSITCLRELTTPSNNSLRHIHTGTHMLNCTPA